MFYSFKTGNDVRYLSFADALQADWFIRNAQITWAEDQVQFSCVIRPSSFGFDCAQLITATNFARFHVRIK